MFSVLAAHAQSKIGVGLVAGAKSAISDDNNETLGVGINGRIEISIGKKLSVVPNFNYFLPTKVEIYGSDVKLTLYQISSDLHYSISNKSVNFYALAGLDYNVSQAKSKPLNYNNSYSDRNIGINAGIGFSSEIVYDEVAYNTEIDQVEITFGFFIGSDDYLY